MCGIYVSSVKEFCSEEKLNIAKKNLLNRGPDNTNHISIENGPTLLHTRLAIQDESIAGIQPMFSSISNKLIVYNGEIYNYSYLKNYLQKTYSFCPKSNCDTELLLEGFSLEGKSFIEKIDGIYAFVIYDKDAKLFYVARDKYGIKPLLYSILDEGIIFSSDVKTLFEILNQPEPSNKAIIDLLSLTFVPEPRTLFDKIKYFESGYLYTIDIDGKFRNTKKINFSLKSKKYKSENLNESANNLQKLIEQSVKDQIIADSQVGLFLSSGIDSSILLATLVKIKYDLSLALTLSWQSKAHGTDSQESENAASKLITKISKYKHLEIEPNISLLSYKDVLIYLIIEGISDPAALATFYLSKIARKNGCKVMLAGQGADELLYGYRRHQIVAFYGIIKRLPKLNTLHLEKILLKIKFPFIHSKIRRFIKLLKFFGNNTKELLVNLYSWVDEATLIKILMSPENSSLKDEIEKNNSNKISHKSIEYLDFKYDLKSLNLRYSDRLGMYSSIEIRVPYLSMKIINYVKSLPQKFKYNFSNTKFILKKLSKKLLPSYITNRSKTGFSLPLNSLLTNDKDAVLASINKKNKMFDKFFNKKEVLSITHDFYKNKNQNSQLIFSIYLLKEMFDNYYD